MSPYVTYRFIIDERGGTVYASLISFLRQVEIKPFRLITSRSCTRRNYRRIYYHAMRDAEGAHTNYISDTITLQLYRANTAISSDGGSLSLFSECSAISREKIDI